MVSKVINNSRWPEAYDLRLTLKASFSNPNHMLLSWPRPSLFNPLHSSFPVHTHHFKQIPFYSLLHTSCPIHLTTYISNQLLPFPSVIHSTLSFCVPVTTLAAKILFKTCLSQSFFESFYQPKSQTDIYTCLAPALIYRPCFKLLLLRTFLLAGAYG